LFYLQDVPKARIYKILKTIPNYIYQLKSPKRYPTRHYQVDSFAKLIEIDLAFMTPFNVSIDGAQANLTLFATALCWQ